MQNKELNISKYIISLKKDEDKYKNVIKLLHNSGISNIKKFEAINGNELEITLDNIGYQHPYVNISLSSSYNLYNDRTKFRDLPSKGAIGCYLSHVTLWKKLLESNNEYMLIFEDDVIPLCNNLDNKINNLISEKNDFDILLLGYRIKDKKIMKITKNISRCNLFVLSHSYIISKKGAKKLLKYAFPVEIQLDNFISFYSLFDKDFKIYYSNKMLFEQSSHKSNIQNFCFTCIVNFFLDKNNRRYLLLPLFIYLSFIVFFILKYKKNININL